MGQAKSRGSFQDRLLNANQPIAINFVIEGMPVNEVDRANITEQKKVPEYVLLRHLILTAVNKKFPYAQGNEQGMGRSDGKLWAGWHENFEKDNPNFTVTLAQVIWLHEIIADDNLGLPPSFALWRELLCDYFEQLIMETKNRPTEANGLVDNLRQDKD